MNEIIKKTYLNNSVCEMVIKNELISKKCKAGQFIILRVDENGERIPLTIADYDRDNCTISIIFQIVGLTTDKLSLLNEGDKILDLVGPLGKETEIENLHNVCVIGGGVGCAIAYPLVKALHDNGVNVDSIIGFRNKDIIILEDKFVASSRTNITLTDDGSNGNKGLVTEGLENLIISGNKYDKIFTIGPLIMMKYVTKIAIKHNIPIIVSMNPIMIDGTGMCGCCRLNVDGKMKFACVDGPDFDGTLIDFDEVITRNKNYLNEEKRKRELNCNLLGGKHE